MKLYFPENYKPKLDLKQTEKAIKFVKDFFQESLSAELRLRRVTAPLFVLKGTGINDDLNGVERAVTFAVKEMNDAEAEVVQSLAKWNWIGHSRSVTISIVPWRLHRPVLSKWMSMLCLRMQALTELSAETSCTKMST